MTSAANLEALLGLEVSQNLLKKVGGLSALVLLSDGALRHVGEDDFRGTHLEPLTVQLRAGILVETPLFKDFFVDDTVSEVVSGQLNSAKKGLSILSRKCLLAAQLDLSGGSKEGTFGTDLYTEVKNAFSRLLVEGKVGTVDTQALPVPEVRKRGEKKAIRGGRKEQRKKQMNQEDNFIEKAFARRKMGLSEEEQREQILQSDEVRVHLLKQKEKLSEEGRNGNKSNDRRNEVVNEYKDLMGLNL